MRSVDGLAYRRDLGATDADRRRAVLHRVGDRPRRGLAVRRCVRALRLARAGRQAGLVHRGPRFTRRRDIHRHVTVNNGNRYCGSAGATFAIGDGVVKGVRAIKSGARRIDESAIGIHHHRAVRRLGIAGYGQGVAIRVAVIGQHRAFDRRIDRGAETVIHRSGRIVYRGRRLCSIDNGHYTLIVDNSRSARVAQVDEELLCRLLDTIDIGSHLDGHRGRAWRKGDRTGVGVVITANHRCSIVQRLELH